MSFDKIEAEKIVEMGNWFSQVNAKLREAVYNLINEIYCAIGAEEFSISNSEIDWMFRKIEKDGEEFIRASFRMGEVKTNRWIYINVGKEIYMSNIVAFCEALVGPEGKRLLDYMEGEARKRNDSLKAISLGLVAIRATSEISGK